MVSWGRNRLDVILGGRDSGLYHKSWDGKDWSPGTSNFDKLGSGTYAGQPFSISRKENSIDTFVVGTDGQLYHTAYEDGIWKEAENLGGSWPSQPCAVKLSKDRYDVFIIGLDGALYHKYFDGQLKPDGQEWEMLGGVSRGPPVVCSRAPDNMSIYVLGADGAIWQKRWNGKSYNPSPAGYDSMGGSFADPPVAVCWNADRVDLFATGNDSQLYHKWWDGKQWQPSVTGYENLKGNLVGRPHVVSWGPNRLDIFGISPDRSLVHLYWNGTSWSDFKKLGGVCLRIDSAVCPTANRIDVFYRGVDDTSYHKWYDGNSWLPSQEAAESLGLPNDTSLASLIPITGAVSPDPDNKVQLRLEINYLHSHHKEQFDLYIRAMHNLQLRPETDSMSWYGIASIHGVPYIRWPFEEKEQPQDNIAGYCCHRSVLFPAWHRTYLILLEQAVQGEAMEIAKEFTGMYRDIYSKAATNLRLPYWDWTINNSGLPRAALYDHIAVAHGGPGGVISFKKLPNPLLKYTFKDPVMHKRHFIDGRPNDPNAPDQIWSAWMETMRCPDDDGVSQHDIVDTQMYKQHATIRDNVYKLMTVNEYQPFASTGFEPGTASVNNSQSLEGIHDGIHVLCGIDPTPLDGHMGDPMYAGFDPIFWLHHCNVDRVYSIWQVLHPGVEVQPQVAKETTIMYQMGKLQDHTTPLYPFRHRDGKYFTSPDVDQWDSTLKYGYRYPETPATFLETGDKDALQKYVSKIVIDMYGPEDVKAYPPVPKAALETVNKVCELANGVGEGTSYLEGGFQITPGSYPKFDLNAIHRREWLVNLRIENFAVDGSFYVHFFLGDFSPDPSNWMQDVNLVGTHCVFSSAIGQTGCQNCLQDKKNNAVVSGGISLTNKLLEKDLPDLEPPTVTPYLKENLHWRVQRANGSHAKSSELESLVVTVTCTIVESPEDPAALPIWGVPEVIEGITRDKAGGYDKNAKL